MAVLGLQWDFAHRTSSITMDDLTKIKMGCEPETKIEHHIGEDGMIILT